MTIDRDLQNRAATLVSREVQCCMSNLVATLASRPDDGPRLRTAAGNDLADLCWQAVELASPVLDYEGAAREAGWSQNDEAGTFFKLQCGHAVGYDRTQIFADDWVGLCCRENIEPHECEVYEHWAVSDWLADKLEAAGERVDRDFAGLIVWARTTTGQAISIDAVIERIVAETGYASGEVA